jgi:glycosyltransferase domain-containing protein
MLTLVIPTFNRPHFLARVIKYYVESHFPFEIVVADSSSQAAIEANQRVVNSAAPSLRIDYQLYSTDTNPYLKLVQALGKCTTPYAVICADDDFIITRGIVECVDFLELHQDYAVSRGNATIVEVSAGAENKAGAVFSGYVYPQGAIESADPLERLVEHLQSYTPTYYSIHRRDQLVNNLQQAFENTVDYRFGELLASCLSVVQGKVALLDLMLMVRQGEPAAATVKYGELMLPWTELATRDDFSPRYNSFENCLIRALGAGAGILSTEAKSSIRAAFGCYLERAAGLEAPAESVAAGGTGFRAAMPRVMRLFGSVPDVMQELIHSRKPVELITSPREFYRKVQAKRDRMSLASLTDSRSAFHDDFQPIYQLLRKYPDGVHSGARVDA